MKLFHLADLHVGKTVNGFSMLEDQRFIFGQITDSIKSASPDAVIIAGDVYDKLSPGAEAVELFDSFLTSLSSVVPATVIISGNHDSPERLGFAGRIMRKSGVHLHCAFDGSPRRLTLRDEWGEVDIYTLPFIKPATARRFFPEVQMESYYDAICAALSSISLDTSKRNVLAAHQFFAGSGGNPERSESELDQVGGLDRVDCGAVAMFDYVALGHLHAPQGVGNFIRYAGSPLKYSFSEYRHKKSITVVELGAKGETALSFLPLTPRRDLRRIKGPLEELLKSAELTDDYIHATLTDEEEIRDALGRIRRVYPNCMALAFENSRTRAASDFCGASPAESLTPIELFEAFYIEQNGLELNGEQAAIASAAFAETEGGA